jgi:hypothetical protein
MSAVFLSTASLASVQAFVASAFSALVAVVAAGLHFSVSKASCLRPLVLA